MCLRASPTGAMSSRAKLKYLLPQALGAPYTEQLTLGPPGATSAAAAAAGPCRSLRLQGLAAVAALDTCLDATADNGGGSGIECATQHAQHLGAAVANGHLDAAVAEHLVVAAGRPGLVLLPDSSGDGASWRALLLGRYLSRLPAGGGNSGGCGGRMQQADGGLCIEYSLAAGEQGREFL